MKPIVTLTLNPTIDGSASAKAIRPLRKIRTTDERYQPGGGGINVARVIHELGGGAHAVYLVGGPTGKILDEMMAVEGVHAQPIPIAGTTRIAHTVFERVSGMEYRFVPEGPEISGDEWKSCLNALTSLDFDYIVISGSLPRGLSDDAYHGVVEIASRKGARVVLDTSGPALRATLDRGVFLVKPSLGELEGLIGRKLPDPNAQKKAAQELVKAGDAEIVAVTCGRDGAVIVSKDAAWRVAAPPVLAETAVGAGDSFAAAATLAFCQGRSLEQALVFGVAAGTAAVLSPGAALCRSEDVDRLYLALRDQAQTA